MPIASNRCLDSDEYVELITDYRPAYKPTLEELEKMQLDKWNYPLMEIEHIAENEIPVVLVRFPEMYGGYEYRFCEIEENMEV